MLKSFNYGLKQTVFQQIFQDNLVVNFQCYIFVGSCIHENILLLTFVALYNIINFHLHVVTLVKGNVL